MKLYDTIDIFDDEDFINDGAARDGSICVDPKLFRNISQFSKVTKNEFNTFKGDKG